MVEKERRLSAQAVEACLRFDQHVIYAGCPKKAIELERAAFVAMEELEAFLRA